MGSWDTSRNWRDRLDVQLRVACSLSQFVCLSTALGQPQGDVHVCMARGKLEHSHSSSLLRLPAKEAENSLCTGMWPWNATSSSRSALSSPSCCPAPGLPWASEAQPCHSQGQRTPAGWTGMTQGFSLRELPKYLTIFAPLPAIHTGCSPRVAASKGLLRGKKMQWLCKGRQIPALHPHGPCPA